MLFPGAAAGSSTPRSYDTDLYACFRDLCFGLRGHCGQMSNWMKQPVPFPYFHVLTLLLVIDLFLISYGLVTLDEIEWFLKPFFFAIICICFLGLKDVAIAMSDPFGDDAIDIDLELLLIDAYKNAIALLRDGRPCDGHRLQGLANPITSGAALSPRTPPAGGAGGSRAGSSATVRRHAVEKLPLAMAPAELTSELMRNASECGTPTSDHAC